MIGLYSFSVWILAGLASLIMVRMIRQRGNSEASAEMSADTLAGQLAVITVSYNAVK